MNWLARERIARTLASPAARVEQTAARNLPTADHKPTTTPDTTQADAPSNRATITSVGLCVVCGASLPPGRLSFCTDRCAGDHKRRRQRESYSHVHAYVCSGCGKPLRAGRHRK